MTVDQWLKIVEAFVSIIQVCIWPLVLVFILLYLGAPLKKFIQGVGEFSIKAGATGIEATAKRQQIEAAALLGAAAASRSDQGNTDQSLANEDQARSIANAVTEAVSAIPAQQLKEAHILWVDDRPSNNIYERRAMEALGMRFTLSTSTEDALEKLRRATYHVIISDMGRPPDTQAGYTLLEAVRQNNIQTPFIIYAGSSSPKHREETIRRGGFGTTNNPQELVQLVTDALHKKS